MIKYKTLRRFAILSRARRVGKTTSMYQMIENLIDEGVNPKIILYVSFDNPIVKLVNIETVLSIYGTLYHETKVPVLKIPAIAFLYLLGSLSHTAKTS